MGSLAAFPTQPRSASNESAPMCVPGRRATENQSELKNPRGSRAMKGSEAKNGIVPIASAPMTSCHRCTGDRDDSVLGLTSFHRSRPSRILQFTLVFGRPSARYTHGCALGGCTSRLGRKRRQTAHARADALDLLDHMEGSTLLLCDCTSGDARVPGLQFRPVQPIHGLDRSIDCFDRNG